MPPRNSCVETLTPNVIALGVELFRGKEGWMRSPGCSPQEGLVVL